MFAYLPGNSCSNLGLSQLNFPPLFQGGPFHNLQGDGSAIKLFWLGAFFLRYIVSQGLYLLPLDYNSLPRSVSLGSLLIESRSLLQRGIKTNENWSNEYNESSKEILVNCVRYGRFA